VKKYIIYLFVSAVFIHAQDGFSKINSMPGSFARMGFGARGMGMGNAMLAVTNGNVVSFYNPAVPVVQEGNSLQASYSFLSMDRSLNFLSFTRRFDFYSKKNDSNVPSSTAGVSAGLINKGVGEISLRDREGEQIGTFDEVEDVFFLGIANRFSNKIAVGIMAKYYYNKIHKDVSATALGVDIGVIYFASENLTYAASICDINATYKWDTGNIYGQDGNKTEPKFPVLKKIGVAYRFDDPKILASVEFENSNAGTNFLRMGAEYNIFESLFLRTGFDKLNFSNFDYPMKLSFGFSYFYNTGGFTAGIDYAFVIEPYSPSDQHIIGVNFKL